MATVARGSAPVTWVAGPEGDRVSPLSWSLPYFRAAGVRFRLHWVFIAYAAVVMLRSALGPSAMDAAGNAPAAPAVTGIALVGLLALVTIRELGRTLVVRASGGTAEDVSLWPLGSLSGIDSAPGWRSALAAALAGPCISAVLFALLAVPLGLATGEWVGAAFPNPLDDGWLRNQHPKWIEFLWVVHRTHVQLALLNALPLVPLDMGMVVAATFLRSRGPLDAPRAATKATMAAAVIIAIGALVSDFGTVVAVSAACFALAAFTLRRIQLGDAVQSAAGWMPRVPDADAAEERERARLIDERARQAEQAEAEGRELDRILEKIAQQGLASLTRAEHAALQRATERRRTGKDPPATR